MNAIMESDLREGIQTEPLELERLVKQILVARDNRIALDRQTGSLTSMNETLAQLIERGYRVLDKHTGTSDYEDGCRLVLDRIRRWIQEGGTGQDVDPSIRNAATEAASALYYEDSESPLKESLVSILRTLAPQYFEDFEDSEDLNEAELRAMLLELDPGSFAEDCHIDGEGETK